jgi:hypothetical protein
MDAHGLRRLALPVRAAPQLIPASIARWHCDGEVILP